MKIVIRAFLLLFFLISLVLFLFFIPLKSTLFSAPYIKEKAEKNDLYRVAHESSPQIAETIIQSNTKSKEVIEPEITPKQIMTIFGRSVTTDVVKEKINQAIDQFYNFLATGSQRTIDIKLSDIKPQIEEEIANEIDIPVIFVQNGSAGIQVPEELKVELPEWFLLFYMINISVVKIELILIVLALLLVFGFAWLKGPRYSQKTKSLSFVLNISGVLTILVGGAFWFVSKSGNFFSDFIGDYLKIPADDAIAIKNFFSNIVSDIAKIYFFIGVPVLVLGITLRIVSIYIKKLEVKKFQKEHQNNQEQKIEQNNHK